MSQDKKRLDKIMESLKPKQAVLLWMQETHQHGNVVEYLSYLRSQPDTAYPLWRLPDKVEIAIRTTMKGQPKDSVNTAVRRAIRDVLFLFHLHQRVNTWVITERRAWDLQLKVLAERLLRIIDEQSSSRREHYITDSLADRLNRGMPYPLNTDTSDAVQATIRNEVTTWEMIEEDSIESWLYNHLISQGAIQLPNNSCEFRDGKLRPIVDEDNESQVRECFKDAAQFERFRSGEDYSHGLAGVTDAEYNQHYETMVSTLHGLVDSGQVKAGDSIYLETVPIMFLREAPLVECEWIDCYVIEMAEWGALLLAKGYKLQKTDSDHPLSEARFVRSDGTEAEPDEVIKLRKQVASNLAKLPGRAKKINSRPYIHFEDYCNWPGRKIKGDLLPDIQKGLVTASWDTWVNAQGGEGIATLAVVPVTLLRGYIDGYLYYTYSDRAEDHLLRRKQLLDSLHTSPPMDNQQGELIQDWKDTIAEFLIEVRSFRDVVTSISQHYFDGNQLLFPDLDKVLSDVIDGAEELVGIFNDIIDEGMEQYEKMDMEDICRATAMRTNQKTAYFVDMAKAETLENIGEKQAARELTGRYL